MAVELLLSACGPPCIQLPFSNAIENVNQTGHLTEKHHNIREKFLRHLYKKEAFQLVLPNSSESLTNKEKECLQLLLTEHTAKNIASRLNISTRTAEIHLENIRQKLQCANKIELITKIML